MATVHDFYDHYDPYKDREYDAYPRRIDWQLTPEQEKVRSTLNALNGHGSDPYMDYDERGYDWYSNRIPTKFDEDGKAVEGYIYYMQDDGTEGFTVLFPNMPLDSRVKPDEIGTYADNRVMTITWDYGEPACNEENEDHRMFVWRMMKFGGATMDQAIDHLALLRRRVYIPKPKTRADRLAEAKARWMKKSPLEKAGSYLCYKGRQVKFFFLERIPQRLGLKKLPPSVWVRYRLGLYA